MDFFSSSFKLFFRDSLGLFLALSKNKEPIIKPKSKKVCDKQVPGENWLAFQLL
jgi:hypothetical protein